MFVLSRQDTFGHKWRFFDTSYWSQVSNLDGVVFQNNYRSQIPVTTAGKKAGPYTNLRYGLVG